MAGKRISRQQHGMDRVGVERAVALAPAMFIIYCSVAR
jgi:hypothetical protein